MNDIFKKAQELSSELSLIDGVSAVAVPDDPVYRIDVCAEKGWLCGCPFNALDHIGADAVLEKAGWEFECNLVPSDAPVAVYARKGMKWKIKSRRKPSSVDSRAAYLVSDGDREYWIEHSSRPQGISGWKVRMSAGGSPGDALSIDRYEMCRWIDALYKAKAAVRKNTAARRRLSASTDGKKRWFDFFNDGGNAEDCEDGTYRVFDPNGDGPMKFWIRDLSTLIRSRDNDSLCDEYAEFCSKDIYGVLE